MAAPGAPANSAIHPLGAPPDVDAADDLARFATLISHDFSGPLRAMRGFAGLVVDNATERLNDEERSYLGEIITGAERMQALNDGLVAHLRARSAPLELTAVNLDAVLSSCLDEFRSRIADRGARITAASLPVVRADGTAIRLVFHHLLDNALRYSAGRKPTIDIAATRGPADWTITIRDHGPGIARNSREQVLTLFKRLDPGLDPDRPGIGLTLCRTIVARHGGRLWIDEPAGGGTAVVFTLPTDTIPTAVGDPAAPPSDLHLEEQFRAFLLTSPDAVVISSADGTIMFVNSRAEAVFGHTRAEMLGQQLEILLPKRFRRSHTNQRAGYVAQPRSRPMGSGLELTGLRADGSEFPLDISLSPMKSGVEMFVVAAIQDVTERKQLTESRNTLAAIVDSSDDAIISQDLDGVILSWNRAAEKLYGYAAAEAIGQHVSIVLPPDRPDEAPLLRKRVRSGARVDRLETLRIRKDGAVIDASLTISPVRDAKGAIVAASVIARDVTERRRAEDQMRAFLEFAPDAIVVIDRQGAITAINARTEAVFGYGRDELVGQPLEMLLPERFRDGHAGHRRAFTAEPETRSMGGGLDLYGRRRDGTEFPVDIQLSSLPTKDGVHPVAAIRDVTERRSLENVRDEFIRNAAHELRTPLTTLAGLGETLAGSLDVMAQTDIDDALAAMTRQGERARVLIANLLDLSQVEGGRAGFTIVDTELRPLVDLVLESAPPPEGSSASTAVPRGLSVRADPVRLEQILTNLLVNSYRYGGTTVSIDAECKESRVLLSVTDDGGGVDLALVPKLFEPFTRGTGSNAVGGSGIGLALCRRLAEAMGGEIWYETRSPRGGACFRVSLPAVL